MATRKLVKVFAPLALVALAIGALVAALGWLAEFFVLALTLGAGWAVWRILPDQSASSDNLIVARASADAALANEQANAAEAQVNDLRAQMTKREWEQRQLSERLVEAERAVAAAKLEAKNAEARAAEVEGQIQVLAEMKAEVESLTGEHGALVEARDKAQDDFISTMAELVSAKERISDFEHMLAHASQWYEDMDDKLAAALGQAEAAQDQLAQTLDAIRAATGINGDLSPETAEEMLGVWKEHFSMQTALAAEAAARAEFDQLEKDHQALDNAHHELLANLGQTESANPALPAPDPTPPPDGFEGNWGRVSGDWQDEEQRKE